MTKPELKKTIYLRVAKSKKNNDDKEKDFGV